MNKKSILKIIILTILVLGILLVLTNPEVIRIIAHPYRLKHFILRSPGFAPIIFIGVYTLRTFLIIIPAWVFTVASGVLFGKMFSPALGIPFAFLISMIGAFFSASIAFWIGKSLMAEFVQKHLDDRIKFLKEDAKGHFKLILYLRLIMIMPFDAFGYAAGAANVAYKDFILGTMIGIIPEFLGYTYLGYTGARHDISWKQKLLISAGLLSLILVFHFGKKAYERLKNKKNEGKRDDT